MAQHCKNGLAVAQFLQANPLVEWVRYPDLPGDRYHDLQQKYLPNGSCGVVSFGVAGGRDQAEALMSRLKVAQVETHVADSHTCCLHPASTTHRQMTDEELTAAGISPDLIRVSLGLENADDLIEDIRQALETAVK